MSAADQGSRPPTGAVLPALRQDLQLIETAPDINGARRWLVYDPLAHKFIAIGQSAHVLLQVWRAGATVEATMAEAWTLHSETLSAAEITTFVGFLQASRLTLEAPGGGWKALSSAASRHRASWASHLLRTYLFFRVPLVQPEKFLRATLASVRWLGTRRSAFFILLTGFTGLYLVSREWDEFRATFAGVVTLEGAALLGVALMVVKLIHELGHAYVATAHGCRVPVIGVAFILGAPLLYCDVTDAWRLRSSKARLQVDVAGILADLSVSCIASFLWAFMPPGLIKHFMFSLATAGWVLSLTLNLNPFMKFDGYHIASDLIGIENLQDRSIALGRWRLREVLFGLRRPPPEQLPNADTTALMLYAWSLWLYRLVVFTGIALVVYGLFFKLAGLVLFAVEIGYFVIAPMVREVREWWTMRQAIFAARRGFISFGLLAAGIGVLATPLSSQIRLPAVIEARQIARIYPSMAAKVATIDVAFGARVARGDRLVHLDAADLRQDLALNRLKATVVALRLDRGASDTTDREEAAVLEHERAALAEQRAGLTRQVDELDLVAPFAGQIVELMSPLHVGRSLGLRDPVVVIRGDATGEVRGALDESQLWRLKAGATAVFVPDDLALPSAPVRIESVSLSAMSSIDPVELASSHGGRVADRLDARKLAVPVTAQYAVRGDVEGQLPEPYAARSASGVLVAQGAAESAVARFWRQVLKVLVRESGL